VVVGGIIVLAANMQGSGDWTSLGVGTDGGVRAITRQPDGKIVAGGLFNLAGGVPAKNIALWNGTSWEAMGAGLDSSTSTFGTVASLATLPDGTIVAAGNFDRSGSTDLSGLARWNGTAWVAFNCPLAFPMRTCINSRGHLVAATGSAAAEWDGAQWQQMPPAPTSIYALAPLPNGGIVAGGSGGSLVARWNGSEWTPMPGLSAPTGMLASVESLAVLPSGEVLAGGWFTSADGAPVTSIARWAPGGIPPNITTSPASTIVCEGNSFRMNAIASGTSLTYQWRKNGVDLAGETSPTLERATAHLDDEAMYDCIIRNGCGTAITDAATLYVIEAINIVEQPATQHLVPGTTATFIIRARGEGLGYQWRRNSLPLQDDPRIGGATTDTLTIQSANSNDQAIYDCIISNDCGNRTSSAANLDCRPIIESQPIGGSFYSGTTNTLTADVTTAGATSYRWKKDGVNIINGLLFRGATTPTLTIIAEDPNQSGTFVLSITNSCGTSTTRPEIVTVSCVADFNLDGGADGGDVVDFFTLWADGSDRADVNQDGGIDFGDVDRFFARWESGC
jgi:hypothetical protein